MKTAVLFIISAALSLTADAARYRYVTFNVWGDYFGNPPAERDVQEAALLKRLDPDFIALQEMTANFWKSRLVDDLSGKYEAVGRNGGDKGGDSFTPLLFRKDRFGLLEKGTVLFHPELDVSKGVVWAAVKDKESGERIVTFSTHFWWRKDGVGDDYIRLENVRRLYGAVSEVAKRHSAAIVGGGDLNSSR
jgi:endonuclease/exonuclease/phosphatase family metal-dependent hydrolase